MSSPSPALPAEVVGLVEQKKFPELEDLWTRRMEEAPGDLPFFFALAQLAKKKGGPALQWMRFLADYEKERGDAEARVAVALESARLFPTDADVRAELDDALRRRFASHPVLGVVVARFSPKTASDPADAGSKIRRWLSFAPGDVVSMAGRGAGRIVELNPALDVVRVEFASGRLPFSLVSAEKALSRLPEGHFLRIKLEDPAALRSRAESDPPGLVRLAIESFGRALTLGELKEAAAGIVDEGRWTAFWAAARRDPRLLVSGSGKSAAVSWTTSAGVAEDSLRREFSEAEPLTKIEIARKNAKRSKALASEFAAGLAEEARKASDTSPALAWELSQAAARLSPGEPEAFPAERLLASPDLARTIAGIRDQAVREKALEAVRATRPDALDLLAEQFAKEDDGRVLAAIFRWLGDAEDRRTEIVRRTLRSPRSAPRAFLWLCERARDEQTPLPPNIFPALLDALRQEEFAPFRARVKELFDPGDLAVRLARAAPSEKEAREYLDALNRAGGLEEHRRTTVREALLMTYPDLRSPGRVYVYSTAEAIEGRRAELAHLRQVDLPANAEAMRAAKEHGDLSENFEYHAARQRHEYLSARIAALADELSRARVLEPGNVESSEVRVGTRVALRLLPNGAERTVTILGPWDSRPQESIYSYESEFAQRLLGSRPGDRVALPEGDAQVLSIAPWKA